MNKILRIFLTIFLTLLIMGGQVNSALALNEDGGADADWWDVGAGSGCGQYVTSSVCGQSSYDTCSPVCLSDGRAAYNCHASQSSICSGTVYCGAENARCGGGYVPQPSQTCPAPGQAGTQQVCGQWTYDNCTVVERFSNGSPAKYSCFYSANSNCQGTIQCTAPAVYQPTPVTYVPPVVITPVVTNGGQVNTQSDTQTNRQTNTQTQSNNQTQSVVVNAAQGVPQVVTRTEIIRETPIAIQVAAVTCPAGTTRQVQGNQIVCVHSAAVVTVAGVKELPKTGLPLAVWAAAAFVPAGLKLRRFKRGLSNDLSSHPNYIWEDRSFKI